VQNLAPWVKFRVVVGAKVTLWTIASAPVNKFIFEAVISDSEQVDSVVGGLHQMFPESNVIFLMSFFTPLSVIIPPPLNLLSCTVQEAVPAPHCRLQPALTAILVAVILDCGCGGGAPLLCVVLLLVDDGDDVCFLMLNQKPPPSEQVVPEISKVVASVVVRVPVESLPPLNVMLLVLCSEIEGP